MSASGSTLGLWLLLFLSTTKQCNCLVNTNDLERPGKNLCNNYIKTINCSNQIRLGSSDADCVMRVINRTSSECSDSSFNGEQTGSEEYGRVDLKPYPHYYEGKAHPNFNITFTNIKWTRLKMRFVDLIRNKSLLCRDFKISGTVDSSSILTHDCLWSTSEGYPYSFQYALTAPDDRTYLHSYLLRLPIESDVLYSPNVTKPENYIFMVIDHSTLPTIRLRLQVPATELRISSTNVTLFYKQDKNSSAKALEERHINFTNKLEGDFHIGEPYTLSETGYYYFNATIYSAKYCKGFCIESSTPKLQYTEGDRAVLKTAVIVLIVLMALIMVITPFGFLWISKVKNKQKFQGTPPKILFVYEPSYPVQVENMYKIKQFLEEHCGVAPKFDLIDILKSKTKNPCAWYCEAFEEADCVLVFASPGDISEKGLHEDNVYEDLHFYATKFLVQHLRKNKSSVACIKLPGCSWKTLSHEARLIDKKFSLPENLSKLLKFMNVAPVPNGSSLLVTALQKPRSPPQTSHVIVATPPEDNDDESDDSEPRGPFTVGGIPLNMSGRSTSEEEDEDDDDEDEDDVLQISSLALKL